MSEKRTNTGKEFEQSIAQAYRDMGARKVEHNVEVSGNQIDVYVEMDTLDRGVHRIVIEAKDHSSPVGIKIVNDYIIVVNHLHQLRLIDEGVIVSATGYSKEARTAAKANRIRLLEPSDLDTIITERKDKIFRSSIRNLSYEINSNLVRLEEFALKEYRVENNMIFSKNKENILMNYFKCTTGVFDSNETQKAISTIEIDIIKKLFQVYSGFREINDKADALHRAFRPSRASLYISAINSFESDLGIIAENLVNVLYQKVVVSDT
jgi:hypothetical protein